jgi:hypothetical protein
MMKLRSVAVGIALAAAFVAAPAHAQDTTIAQDGAGAGGWNTPYGLIFSVENVFQNNSDALIDDYAGGVGVQYNLSAQRALRFSVNLARQSSAAYETETTSIPGGGTTQTFNYPDEDFTSRYDVNLGAMYVVRLSPAAISPYLGFGGGIGFVQEAYKFDNETYAAGTMVESYDDMHRDLSLNASGTLGLEWRVHKSVSLFAEYGLGVALATWESDKDERTVTTKATGAVTGSSTEGSNTRFLNWGTGLGQGGQIGLVAFF